MVIGILIALQINTWNQSRVNAVIKKKILQELEISLKNSRGLIEQIDFYLNETFN